MMKNWGEGASDASSQEGGGAAAQAGDATWTLGFFGTPASSWNTAGGDFSGTASASQASVGFGQVSLSGAALIADVQSWINNPASNFGWALLGDEETEQSARRFGSSENPAPGERPVLNVSFSTLPIKLLAFNGILAAQDVKLSWRVEDESQVSRYVVENAGANGKFYEIGHLKAGDASASYAFLTKANSAKPYYRLAWETLDGARYFSKTIRVQSAGGMSYSLVANPVRDLLKLQQPVAADTRFVISDAFGRRLMQGLFADQGVVVTTLAAGNYYLVLEDKSGKQATLRFVKH